MNSLAGKRLLILDGTQLGCEIVLAAQSMGIHTVVTDYNTLENAPAKQIADEHFMVNVTEVERVVELIHRESIDGVVAGFSDFILPYYAQICKKAGLPCYASEDLFRLFTDKLAYKKLCATHEVPIMEGYELEQFQGQTDSSVRFPVIVKPTDGSGSRGVSICNSAEEVLLAVDLAHSWSKTGEILIEQYVNGQEATVFWILQDGDYYVSAMANRHIRRPQGQALPLPVGYSMPSHLLDNYEQTIAPKAREMFRAVGMKNGMMFMQGIVDEGVFRVYDIGYRVTGTQEYHLLENVSGYNPLSMLINFALTASMGEPDLASKANPYFSIYAYNVSALMQPGEIDHFEGLEAARALPGVISVVKAHVEGDILPEEARGQLRQIAVRVQGVANSLTELKRTMTELSTTVKVVNPSGEDLTLPGIQANDLDGLLLSEPPQLTQPRLRDAS